MSALEILGTATSLSLLAGWRLYATVLAVGLAVRFDWWRLPEKLNNLNVLAKDWVLVVAGLGFLCEFFADKIPWLDSIWDSVHTFVRPVGGALVAWSLISPQDHEMQVIYFLLGGGMALLSHATKATTRAVVNQSPEPFSNIAVSLVEDAAVAGGIWLTMTHPLIVLGISLVLTVFFIWLIHRLWRFFRRQIEALRSFWNRLFTPSPA
ncbi:MAG: DUF4126 domain-containing protein [Bryobacteraceae bacterium]|nr:DUF4126 domain-containing protein [Bryobacteraceae bacterium]